MAPSASAWSAPGAGTRSFGSRGSAGRIRASPSGFSSTTPASRAVEGRRRGPCLACSGCVCAPVLGRRSFSRKEPQFNGGEENFDGWFQPRPCDRRYARPADLRRGLARLQERSTRSMPIRGLGAGRWLSTAGACGCGNCPRASWSRPEVASGPLPAPGDRHRGGWLTAYLNGRVLKRWPDKLRNN
jgi:hypothetical protein